MRIAYLDACAGVSGDMLLGALIQAGAPTPVLRETLERLGIGATLAVEEVDRCGIHSVKAHILVGGRPAELAGHGHGHSHGHGHEDEEHGHGHGHHPHPHAPHEPHDHEPHEHEGEHAQEHGGARSLPAIRRLIEGARLERPVRDLALRAFELLGAAEARIHDRPVEEIHFHEVGAVDAIADIVLTAAGAHALGVEGWRCSPLNVGGGTVVCAHGRFPVPAPATAELLRGAPTYSSGAQMELVTPTGAALVRALGCAFGPAPAMTVRSIGYGAGTRNPGDFANVLRLSLGEAEEGAASGADQVVVLEAAVDDLNPQLIAHAAERALKAGALDAMCTPVLMKKGRPGTLITVLCDRKDAPALQELLLTETSTLGLRYREERRICLERHHVDVATEWGRVRVKVGRWKGRELTATPEFEDCRALAAAAGVPLKRILEAALRAYREA